MAETNPNAHKPLTIRDEIEFQPLVTSADMLVQASTGYDSTDTLGVVTDEAVDTSEETRNPDSEEYGVVKAAALTRRERKKLLKDTLAYRHNQVHYTHPLDGIKPFGENTQPTYQRDKVTMNDSRRRWEILKLQASTLIGNTEPNVAHAKITAIKATPRNLAKIGERRMWIGKRVKKYVENGRAEAEQSALLAAQQQSNPEQNGDDADNARAAEGAREAAKYPAYAELFKIESLRAIDSIVGENIRRAARAECTRRNIRSLQADEFKSLTEEQRVQTIRDIVGTDAPDEVVDSLNRLRSRSTRSSRR